MKKHNKIICSIFAGSLLISANCLAAVPASGKNGNVEWRQRTRYQLPTQPVDFVNTLDGSYTFILTGKGSVLIYDTKGTLLGTIPVDQGVTALDADVRGNILYLMDSEKNIASSLALDFAVDINTTDAPFKGDINAPVTIAVFSDFQ
jgi:hypothetical protein